MNFSKHFYLLILLNLGVSLFYTNVLGQVLNTDENKSISIQDRRKNASLFIEANKEKNDGNLERAIELFKEGLEYDPSDAASMYELAKLYLLKENLMDATLHAEKSITIDTLNFWYKQLLSTIYKLDNKLEESKNVLEDLVRQNPEKIDPLKDLAYTYAQLEQNEKAIDALNVIERKSGINEQLSIQKQKLYQNLNNGNAAVSEIEKLINKFPYETRYYALLAELSLKNDLKQKALWAYSKVKELEPDNAYINISLSDFYLKARDSLKAFEELKLGFANTKLDVDSKIQILLSYYSVEQIFGDNNDEADELISILMSKHPLNQRVLSIKSEILYRSQKYPEAKKIVVKILEIDSTQYPIWEQLLIIESSMGDIEMLNEHSQKLINQFPTQAIPYLFGGIAKFQMKDYEIAYHLFKDGLKLVVNNLPLKIQFYSFIGDTSHELDKTEESDQAYETVLQLDPDNALALNNYAYYLSLRSENLERAKEMSFKAVELDPGNASNIDTKAWVLYKLKEFEQAKIWIEKALKANSNPSAEVLEHCGDIYIQLNEKRKAIKYWKKALKAGDGSEFLKQKIKEKKLYE
ncbi:MAG: tetratricopeptide repeat protein [Bacteroidetes bacterium]|nr:tetratricopeptide repeat protein [Bacteroidota bacterium]